MLLGTDIDVLSKNSLWTFGDDNKPVLVNNTYNNLEVIRYFPMGRSMNFYVDIPIEDSITPFFPYGTFFFKTEKECNRYAETAHTLLGQLTILENAFSTSRRNKNITKIKYDIDDDKKIKDGLYSIKEFDDYILDTTGLKDYVCYIDEDNQINKIKQADDILIKYLRDYCKMVDLISERNFERERIIFEVYKENSFLYINHIFINSSISRVSSEIFCCSRILNYPICATEIRAQHVKILKENNYPITKIMDDQQRMFKTVKRNLDEIERKRKLRNKIVKICAEAIWEHKGSILKGLKTLL